MWDQVRKTMTDKPHSIKRHPLAGEPDFSQIRNDVQFARITWPVGFEVVPPVFMRQYGPLNKSTGGDYRADGRCICELCGEEYRRHPMDHFELSYSGEPFLNVLCNGDRVKL